MASNLTINKELNNERIYKKIMDGYNQGLRIAEARQGDLFPEDVPDLPIHPDTRLGDFQEQGGYLDEKPMRDLNPRRKGGYVPPRTRWSEENKRRNLEEQGKQKRIEDWRREQGLEGTNVEPNFFQDIDVPVIQYLESSGLGDSLKVGDWNPRKSARDKKIRELKQRAGTPGEKAAAENKQSDEAKVDIPDFLTIRDMKEALQREGIGNVFDQEMDKYREQKDSLTIKERIDALSKNKLLRDGLTTAFKAQGLKIGKSVARNLLRGYVTWSLMR
tara:strand:+ start:2650 stop:3471 length:822 start_codon:yes stop_codon:yes gene_type:complete